MLGTWPRKRCTKFYEFLPMLHFIWRNKQLLKSFAKPDFHKKINFIITGTILENMQKLLKKSVLKKTESAIHDEIME